MYDADHTSVRTADRVKMDGYEISWNRDSELTKPSGWRTTDDEQHSEDERLVKASLWTLR